LILETGWAERKLKSKKGQNANTNFIENGVDPVKNFNQ
jgi:hypothetical protein